MNNETNKNNYFSAKYMDRILTDIDPAVTVGDILAEASSMDDKASVMPLKTLKLITQGFGDLSLNQRMRMHETTDVLLLNPAEYESYTLGPLKDVIEDVIGTPTSILCIQPGMAFVSVMIPDGMDKEVAAMAMATFATMGWPGASEDVSLGMGDGRLLVCIKGLRGIADSLSWATFMAMYVGELQLQSADKQNDEWFDALSGCYERSLKFYDAMRTDDNEQMRFLADVVELEVKRLYGRERESPRLQSWDESDPTKNFNNQSGYIQSAGV